MLWFTRPTTARVSQRLLLLMVLLGLCPQAPTPSITLPVPILSKLHLWHMPLWLMLLWPMLLWLMLLWPMLLWFMLL